MDKGEVNQYLTARLAGRSTTVDVGTLRDGRPFELLIVQPDRLDDIVSVHRQVIDSLADHQKTYVVPKSRDDFANHLARQGIILGICVEGEIVATASMRLPTKQNADTGLADMAPFCRPDRMAVLQSAAVLPAFQGHGLQQVLIDARLKIAGALGRRHAVTEVHAENVASTKSLMKSGLVIKSAGVDAVDGTRLFNLYARVRPIGKAFNAVSKKPAAGKGALVVCDVQDFDVISRALSDGYRGVGVTRDDQGRSLIQLRATRPARKS